MRIHARAFHRPIAPIALALSVLLMLAPTALATGADVYGVGGGSINLPTGQKFIKFAFSAHTGASGDFGSFRFTIEDPNAPLDAHVDVDCVNVFANPPGAGGWIGGAITKVTPYPNIYDLAPGDQMAFGINDYGNPGGLVPDELAGYYGFPQVCKLQGPTPQIPISQGNITIKLP
jgi:hypothetical protein